ncbi:MAG: MFS transporter [Actinobacteria bacterium]|nr:MFS transporter [Actinomycetota bacterium]
MSVSGPLSPLIAAHAVSLLGNVVAAVAVPWFVLSTTGSPARTGVIAFFAALPVALGSAVVGGLTDRLGARRMSVVADVLSAVSVAAVPLLYGLGQLSFWLLASIVFMGAVFDGPGQAARQALVPALAQRSGVSLERANSLFTATEHLSYILGAPIAGALIVSLGAPAALWLDAGTFVVSAALVVAAVPSVRAALPTARYVHDVVEGLRFAARDHTVLTFLLLTTAGNLIMAALAPVLLPVYAREVAGGAGWLGLMIAGYGVGGLLGTVLFGVLSGRLSRRRFYVLALLGLPISAGLLVLLPPAPVAAGVLLALGVAPGVIVPLRNTVLQERTPFRLRGRVFSLLQAAHMAVVPFGLLLTGLLVEALGLRVGLLVFAAGLAAFSTTAVLVRPTRRLEPLDVPGEADEPSEEEAA